MAGSAAPRSQPVAPLPSGFSAPSESRRTCASTISPNRFTIASRPDSARQSSLSSSARLRTSGDASPLSGPSVQGGFPFIPGFELAGEISAVGNGVEGLPLGDRVAAMTMVGAYAEEVVVDAANTLPAPLSLDPAQLVELLVLNTSNSAADREVARAAKSYLCAPRTRRAGRDSSLRQLAN